MTAITHDSLINDARAEYRRVAEQAGTDPVEFEGQALSIGDDYLPDFARAVRDGGEPTAEYFGWLADQLELANAEG